MRLIVIYYVIDFFLIIVKTNKLKLKFLYLGLLVVMSLLYYVVNELSVLCS